VFSAADKSDAVVRITIPRSSGYGLEGLVRDNRVEVRVLFGAPHERPRTAGLFALRADTSPARTTASWSHTSSRWP